MGDRTKIEWTRGNDGSPGATWNPIRAWLKSPLADQADKPPRNTGSYCELITPGCEHCYAEAINKRLGTGLPYRRLYRDDVEIFLDEKILEQPLHWKRPRRIFPCSMTDLFGEWVTDEMLDRICDIMFSCRHHTFLLLTKRAERMRDYVLQRLGATLAVNATHIWLGVSVEDQRRADERLPLLMQTSAAVRWVSAEPLLGPIDLSQWLGDNPIYDTAKTQRRICLSSGSERRPGDNPRRDDLARSQARLGQMETMRSEPPVQTGEGRARFGGGRLFSSQGDDRQSSGLRSSSSIGVSPLQGAYSRGADDQSRRRQQEEQSAGLRGEVPNNIQDSPQRPLGGIIWAVIGGESGPGARPFGIGWARSIIAQCKAAGVPVFMKQVGARPYYGTPECGPKLRDRKGGDPDEWPVDIRVREYPQ